jgi:hypothetical protein
MRDASGIRTRKEIAGDLSVTRQSTYEGEEDVRRRRLTAGVYLVNSPFLFLLIATATASSDGFMSCLL